MPSIAEQVLQYIRKKPYVHEALEQDIVNFSALSRKIAEDIEGARFDAVKAALVRSARKIRKEKRNQEKRAIDLLDNSRFSIENKIAIIRSKDPLKIEHIAHTETPSGHVYVLAEKKALHSGHDIESGLSMISITSPSKIRDVPGVISFIYSALASESINVCETLSCGRDTLIVVNEYDAPLAFSTLAERMRMTA